jgi:hypothetical protein
LDILRFQIIRRKEIAMQHHHTVYNANRLASGFILLLTLLLSGCPSGESSTAEFGNSLPPATGPGDVENFFPTTIGSSWNYFATVTNPLSGAPAYFMDQVTVIGTNPVNGQIASVFEESEPSGSGVPISAYFLKNAGGLAYLGNSDATDKITPAIVPYILATFPVMPGIVAKFGKSGLDFGADLDGDGINESVNVSVTNTIDDFEPLEIGIGTFSRTVKSNETIGGTVILSASKISVPFSGSTTRWLAPGIGVLKNNQTVTAQTGTSMVTTVTEMEARGYVVSDGSISVAHGLGLPFQVTSGLGSGDSNLQSPGAPAVASDGSHFLVVTAKSDASAMLGQLMDSKGVLISAFTLAPGTAPVVAFDGTNYWVVYSASSTSAAGCYAQRVTSAGTVLDPVPVVLSASSYCVSPQRVAFGNSSGLINGLIVYSRFNSTRHDLYGVLVNLDGTIQGPEFPIVADGNDNLSPVVAFDGTNYMVAWEQRPTATPLPSYIYATRVTPAGVVLNPAGFAISTNVTGQYSPSIAFDGSNYLISWLDLRAQTGIVSTLHPDIYAVRVSPVGFLLDGFLPSNSGFLLSNGAALQLYSPYVAYTGSEYLVAWGSLDYGSAGGQGVQAARVSTAGTLPGGANKHIAVSGPPPTATTSRYVYPVIGAGNSAALMVWLDNTEVSGVQKGVLGVSVAPF